MSTFISFHIYVLLFVPASASIYLFFFLIGVKLLYNVVLISSTQQCESAICIHITLPLEPLSHPPHLHPSRSSQSTWLSSLCDPAASY